MNCTGKSTRERICREYEVEVLGCYKLFDGRTVISDAGGKLITDTYYMFKCIHRTSREERIIRCGKMAAKHICDLSGKILPSVFNPFQQPGHGGGTGGGVGPRWNRSRKQLYYAIKLFIMRYNEELEPNSAIYDVLSRVESVPGEPATGRDVSAVNTILEGFHTTMTTIITHLTRTRAVREFHFDALEPILLERGCTTNNFR